MLTKGVGSESKPFTLAKSFKIGYGLDADTKFVNEVYTEGEKNKLSSCRHPGNQDNQAFSYPT